MPNTTVKIAFALFLVVAAPAASFARHGGSTGFARPAGSAATGNVPISGIARGPANAGGMNNVVVDPSGIGNASRMGTLPQPNIAAPTLPGGSRNPAAPPSMNFKQQALPEGLGGGGGTGGGGSPAARRSSALGAKPDGSEGSNQPGERGARPDDQRHLPRLLNIRSAIRREEIGRNGEARKTVAQFLERVTLPDFR